MEYVQEEADMLSIICSQDSNDKVLQSYSTAYAELSSCQQSLQYAITRTADSRSFLFVMMLARRQKAQQFGEGWRSPARVQRAFSEASPPAPASGVAPVQRGALVTTPVLR